MGGPSVVGSTVTAPHRRPSTPGGPAMTDKERDVSEAAEASSETPSKPLPAWRQRMYRTPVLGPIAYVIWPPRRSASVVRRVISSTLAIIAILGIGMAAYPWV